MSSPTLVSRLLGSVSGKLGGRDSPKEANKRIKRLGMTPRQQALNRLWSWYRCANYATRRLDWNGREILDPLTMEAATAQGFVPPGMIDSSGQNVPLKFRKPTAPYGLIKVIVDRFTGLLFSERTHPEIRVEGDPKTEDWLRTLADVSRLWPAMIQARTYGGAMGCVAIGFQFVEGRPVIEVHDPRWLLPQFIDRSQLLLGAIEKRYQYMDEVYDPISGEVTPTLMWYRRVIDSEQDVLFKPAPVEQGDEPVWEIEKEVAHGLGFCPVVWIQNMPILDDIDGDPDCPDSVYDQVEAIDSLYAQSNRAIVANCDPTLVITTKAEMSDQIRTGSNNALKIPDGDAKYLEIAGTGPKAAQDLAKEFRESVLEVCQCILNHPDVDNRTATEVERLYSSMLSKGDIIREQYGERGVKPLLEMMAKAARALDTPRAMPMPGQEQAALPPPADPMAPPPAPTAAGAPPPPAAPGADPLAQAPIPPAPAPASQQPMQMVRMQVMLPPKLVPQPDGSVMETPRELGAGGLIHLKWPNYFVPSVNDANIAVQAATGAVTGGVIDIEHAVKLVAPYFNVKDVNALVERLKNDQMQQQADMMAAAMTSVDPITGQPVAPPMPPAGPPKAGIPVNEMEPANAGSPGAP